MLNSGFICILKSFQEPFVSKDWHVEFFSFLVDSVFNSVFNSIVLPVNGVARVRTPTAKSSVTQYGQTGKNVYLSEIEFSGLKSAKTSKTRLKKCFY